jgi:prephenate dehydrogenase
MAIKKQYTITIVGVGLIGGSFAKTLTAKGYFNKVIGVDTSKNHLSKALELGIISEALPLSKAINQSDIIFLAVPVNSALELLPKILKQVKPNQIVLDAGSTKAAICALANKSKNRNCFVATHPMWGTEFSGPQAAQKNAFKKRAVVICNKEDSHPKAVQIVQQLYKAMSMHVIYMNAVEHDVHAAYVSHISHITSFALANTVLEKEKEEQAIFELAGGGFESTVRLAKSNPTMWLPIFTENRENVLDVLNEHIAQLKKFKAALEKENHHFLNELMIKANGIKKILK